MNELYLSMEAQLQELKKNTYQVIEEIEKIENKIYGMEGTTMDKKILDSDLTSSQIMYSFCEMQLDREHEKILKLTELHEKEKEQMRKDFAKWRNWLCGIIVVLILSIVGTVIWFFSSYEISSYSQDIVNGNANFVGDNGYIVNGEADNNNRET